MDRNTINLGEAIGATIAAILYMYAAVGLRSRRQHSLLYPYLALLFLTWAISGWLHVAADPQPATNLSFAAIALVAIGGLVLYIRYWVSKKHG